MEREVSKHVPSKTSTRRREGTDYNYVEDAETESTNDDNPTFHSSTYGTRSRNAGRGSLPFRLASNEVEDTEMAEDPTRAGKSK